ncbi:MAG: ABC transporter permease [Lachnospiraceae bacterium]
MRFFREIKQYWGFAVYAARSDLSAEVANSYLNWLWWVLEPLASMIIYTIVFGIVFKTNEQYFPVFVFVGITMWDFFSRCMTTSIELVRGNQHIISRVYMPKYILLVQRMLVLAFKMLINLGLIAVMMLIYNVPVGINILFLIPTLLVFYAVCFAFGTILLHIGVYVSDLSNALNIVLNLMFYMTGIFYNVQKSFPAPVGYLLQRANPVAHLIFCMRKCVLYNETPSCIMLTVWLVIAVLIAAAGIHLIYKNENDYVKMI